MIINHALRTKITLVTIAAVALFALSVPVANAGTYNIRQCDPGTGAGLTPGRWGNWASGSWGTGNLCPSGITIAGNNLAGDHAGWYTPLPSGLYIDAVSFGAAGVGMGKTSAWAMLCGAGGAPICGWWARSPNLQSDGYGYNYSLSANDSSGFQVAMLSSGTVVTNAWVSLWGFDFTMDDHVAPTIANQAGGTLNTSGGWNRGSRTTNHGVSDDQGGIKTIYSHVDGLAGSPANVTISEPCSYVNFTPCPTNPVASPSLNTTTLSDGNHNVQFFADDAGNNTSSASSLSFKVDNTAPTQPANMASTSDVADGWQATNDFDFAWTNGAEVAETTTQSGIAQVKVNVEPTDPGTQSDPAAVTVPVGGSASGISATTSTVSGVAVPAKGQWTVRLSLIDKAGNESSVGAGGPTETAIGWDDAPPLAPAGRANGWISRLELADGFAQEWIRPTQPPSAAPICGYATSIDETQSSDPGQSITVQGNVNSLQLPTNLAEGEHWVHMRSVTCSGVASSLIESVKAPVDLTDPDGGITGIDEGGWYNHDLSVGLRGTDALSGMAAEADSSKPYFFGAWLIYSFDGTDRPAIRGGNGTVTVSTEGAHELALSAVDFAGNKSQAKTVHFGVDRTAPTGAFSVGDPERPTLLSAPVGDALSGIAAAQIQVRNKAGGDWITLPTTIGNGSGNTTTGYPNATVLTARFPDTKLPSGTYAVRLIADDRATNELATGKRVDGSDMTMSNPIRRAVTLSAGLFKAQRKCSKKKGVKCIKRYRGKVVFTGAKASLSVGFKRGAVVQGVLADGQFNRLARQPIEIYTKANGQPERLAGSTSTRMDGSYVFRLSPGLSRTVRVYFPGTEKIEDTETLVRLGTAAKISLKLSKRHAFTGQTVTFRGQVRSFDGSIPAAGKLVVLQFYAMKKWRPAVAVAHTDRFGRFSVRYKFDGNRVKNRIVFRVFAPSEDSWGHAASASKRVTMKLN
jgi:hypothetical protein